MYKTIITTITVLMVSGCGGGSGSAGGSGGSGGYSGNTKMSPSTTYTVYPGNKIVKDSETAKVQVHHINGHPESTVTLIEGEATIIRQ